MVNIIPTSCVGSYLTTLCFDQRFINPFNWSTVDFKSYKTLLTSYDSIDFNKFRLVEHRDGKRFYVVVDDKVSILYVHYTKDETKKDIVIKNSNVIWCDIEKYIRTKYTERLQMKGVEPVFVCGSSYTMHEYTPQYMKDLIVSNKDKRKLIVVANTDEGYSYLKDLENDYTKIHLSHLFQNNKQLAIDLFEKYKDFMSNS